MRTKINLLFLVIFLSFSFQTQGQVEGEDEPQTISELIERQMNAGKKTESPEMDSTFEEQLKNFDKMEKTKQDNFTLNCSTTQFSAISNTPPDETFNQLNAEKKRIVSVLRDDKEILVTTITGEGEMQAPSKYVIFQDWNGFAIFGMKKFNGMWSEILVVDIIQKTATLTVQGGSFVNVWFMSCK